MKAKYIIGGLIIVLFMVWGTTTFLKTTIQYVSIEKAGQSNRTVQVMGKIDFDAVNFNKDESRLEFTIYDADAEVMEGAERMDIHYYGVVPGNFDQATSVVLKGKMGEEDRFVAKEMLVKCPSKYQGEGNEYQDASKHDEANS